METNNTKANVSQTLIGANDKGRVTYQVNGEDVNLSFQIVRNFLTRGNAAVSDAELVQFISLCRANLLNPFIGDAYMVKYGSEPASMIISKAAFMKRGENSKDYAGYQAGVIILREGKILEEEGSFYLPGDTLIGGWAKVYRKDREHPTIQRVRLQEYNTGKSTWAAKPGTMIRKVAIAQAFREAFPMAVDGMYIPEEMPDEQSAEPMPEANQIKPVFTEADAPAPQEPKEAAKEAAQEAPAPEPEKEFTHWAGSDSHEFNPPIKVKKNSAPTQEQAPDPEPVEEPVPVTKPAAQTEEKDENLDLFKA